MALSPGIHAVLQGALRPTPDTLKLREEFSTGSFGSVCKGDYNEQVVSVKKIGAAFLNVLHRRDNEEDLVTVAREKVTAFKKELRNLKANNYPYIVEILGAFHDSLLHEPLLVAEDLQKDLATFLAHRKGRLKHAEQAALSLQVVTGLRFLRLSTLSNGQLSFWHVLNDRGVFISDRGVAKIFHTGIGLTRKMDPKTLGPELIPYLPPEALHDVDYVFEEKADVFAAGVLMLEVATQRRPLAKHGTSPASACVNRKPDLDLVLESHPLKAGIMSCLLDRPLDRPSVIELHCQLSLLAEGSRHDCSGLIIDGGQHFIASPLQDIPVPSAFGSGTLLGSKVYVGGVRCHDAESSRLVHVFSLHSSAWSSLPPAPLLYSELVGIGGHVTLIGGCDASTWKVTDKTATWNPDGERWVKSFPPMPVKRVRPGVTSSDGIVVVAGGLAEDMKHALETVDVLDVTHHQWSSVSSLRLPRPMSCCHLVWCGDKVYLMGGLDEEKKPVGEMWVIPRSELVTAREKSKERGKGKKGGVSVWMHKGKTPVTNGSYFSSGSSPICVGGSDPESKRPSSAVQLFNAATSQWAMGGALSVSRAHPCVVAVSATAFVAVGGCKSAQHVEDSMVATAEYLFL